MPSANPRILMLLENESFPEDTRVLLEAQALTEAGYRVTVVCPNCEKGKWSERLDGVWVYRYPAPWAIGGFVGYVAEFTYSLLMGFVYAVYVYFRRGFDAIHVHMPPDMNALVGIFFRVLGKRLVVDHHDLSPELYQAQRNGEGNRTVERLLLFFEKLACRNADRLIATNESQRQVQVKRCGVDAKRTYVVRNGPAEHFLGEVSPHEELATAECPVIGYVGIVGIQDGVDQFIHSLKQLRSRGRDFLAVIVGNGPALQDLQNLVESNGLTEFVHFTGLVPYQEVPRYIAAFDVCVTPDPSNAYNDSCTTIKTIEYMALGKPTVAFATTENQYTAGDAALYAPDNDVNAFADLIEQLLDNPHQRHTMGQTGRSRVLESLSWAHQRAELMALYSDLFGRRQQANVDDDLSTPANRQGSTDPNRQEPELLNLN